MLEYIQNPQAKVDSKAGDVLQVIGAGLPRTGTSSLVVALGILGFGPSHHFTEVIYKPESAPVFDRLIQACRIPTSRFAPKSKAESAAILDELREIFRGYKSSLDGPACHFVPELMELYPNAKVVLSVRDNDEVWYKSLMDTVGIQSYDWYWYLKMPTGTLGFTRLARTFFEAWKQGTGGQLRPELHSMHTQWVRKVVPKEKLLEVCTFPFPIGFSSAADVWSRQFNVKQGWGPLCKFLEVPIPDQPFPRT